MNLAVTKSKRYLDYKQRMLAKAKTPNASHPLNSPPCQHLASKSVKGRDLKAKYADRKELKLIDHKDYFECRYKSEEKPDGYGPQCLCDRSCGAGNCPSYVADEDREWYDFGLAPRK